MRDILYGAAVLIIFWALFEQWRRNKDTMNTFVGVLLIGAVIATVLLMVWQKATTGRVHWPISF